MRVSGPIGWRPRGELTQFRQQFNAVVLRSVVRESLKGVCEARTIFSKKGRFCLFHCVNIFTGNAGIMQRKSLAPQHKYQVSGSGLYLIVILLFTTTWCWQENKTKPVSLKNVLVGAAEIVNAIECHPLDTFLFNIPCDKKGSPCMVLLMDTVVVDSCLKEKHMWLFELLAELATFS